MKKVLIISFLIFTILTSLLCTSYAAVAVTEEGLEQAFERFVEYSKSSENNEMNDGNTKSIPKMVIEKNTKKIKFMDDKDNLLYTINYDLDTLTFTTEVTVDNTTTYEEWENKQDDLTAPFILYMLIADLNEIPFKDSMVYFLFKSFGSALDSTTNSNNSYTIQETNGNKTIIDKSGNTIQISEFPKYAVKITKDLYSSPVVYTDSDDNNTFKFVISTIETSEDTSCGLKAVLTVNPNGDFSSIVDSDDDELIDSFISAGNSILNHAQNALAQYQNHAKEENQIIQNYIDMVETKKNSISKLPQTGDSFELKDGLYILCVISFITLIAIVLKSIKYRNIEK